MMRAEMVKKATAAILGPWIEDYKRGRLQLPAGQSAEGFLETMAIRRKPQIDAFVADMEREARKPAPRCANCREPATTVMGGKDYCDRHARDHRAALPVGLGGSA